MNPESVAAIVLFTGVVSMLIGEAMRRLKDEFRLGVEEQVREWDERRM